MSAGGNSNVNFVLSSDGARMENTIARLQDRVAGLVKSMDRLKNAQQQASRQSESSFDIMARRAVQMATSYLGIQRAIQLVISAHKEYERLGGVASTTGGRVASAQLSVVTTLGKDSTDAQVLDFMSKASSSMPGFKQETALEIGNAIYQATLGKDYTDRGPITIATMKSIAPLFWGNQDPSKAGEFGGAAVAIARSLPESMNMLERTQKATSYMTALLSQSRVTDIANVPQLVPAVLSAEINMKPKTVEELLDTLAAGGSIVSAVGVRMNDPYGAQSKTATANLMATFAEFRPELEKKVGHSLDLLGTWAEMQSTTQPQERQRYMTNFLDRFGSDMNGRAAVRPIMKEIFMPGGIAGQMARDAYGPIRKSLEDSQEDLNKFQRRATSLTPELSLSYAGKKAGAMFSRELMEKSQLRGAAQKALFDPDEGAITVAKQGLGGYINAAIAKGGFNVGMMEGADPVSIGALVLQNALRRGGLDKGTLLEGLGSLEELNVGRRTDSNKELVDRIQALIDTIQKQYQGSERRQRASLSGAQASKGVGE